MMTSQLGMETCTVSDSYYIQGKHVQVAFYNHDEIYDNKTIQCEYIKYGYI